MVGVDLNQIKALDVVAYIKLNDFYSSQEVTHLDDAKQQYQELGETILQYLNSQRDEDPQLKKLEDGNPGPRYGGKPAPGLEPESANPDPFIKTISFCFNS